MLEARDVSKSFGGVAAVSGCSIRLESGRITGLIGPNGAGKSTLFNMLTGFAAPDSGRIFLDGEDITALRPYQRFRRGLVRSFQTPREFGRLTVLENLTAVPGGQIGENLLQAWLRPRAVARQEAELRDQADEVLDFLGLMPLRDAPAATLSGGQRKLLELGRTMMARARMVLLDEPGAGVNRTLLGELCAKIETLHREQGYSFCIIEHDMDVIARLCRPVIVLAEGRVLARAPDIDGVRADPAIRAAYLGTAVDEPGMQAAFASGDGGPHEGSPAGGSPAGGERDDGPPGGA